MKILRLWTSARTMSQFLYEPHFQEFDLESIYTEFKYFPNNYPFGA